MSHRHDRTSGMGADKKKRADIVAHGDDRRAQVYRADVEYEGVDRTRRIMPNSERVKLAARAYKLRQAGMSIKEIAVLLKVSHTKASCLHRDHLIYEVQRKNEEKRNKK